MKYVLSYITALVLSMSGFAQLKEITVDWNIDSFSRSSEYPVAYNMGDNLTPEGLLEFSYSWRSSVQVDASKVLNPVFESIDGSKLTDALKSKINSKINLKTTNTLAAKITYQVLTFNPIVKIGNSYKKIISFSVKETTTVSSNKAKGSKILAMPRNSVLAQGEWFKFIVDTTGVYKITPDFLNSIGMNLNGVDPNSIKIYGNGGLSLPLSNDENDIFDVPENPIKIVGAGDGVFSGDDFILFYGRGTRGFVQENLSHINPYSDMSYYYVTTSGGVSRKIEPMIEPVDSAVETFTTYDFETFHERDLVNIGGLGRIWHGEKFDIQTKRDFSFNIPSIATDSEVDVSVKFSGVYTRGPILNLKYFNNNTEFTTDSGKVAFSGGVSSRVAYLNKIINESIDGFSGGNFRVSLDYDKAGDPTSEGFLDYIQIKAKSNLIDNGLQFGFFNNQTKDTTGVGRFVIGNAQNVSSVWDVTNPYTITEKENERSNEFDFKFNLGEIRKYVSINSSDFYAPTSAANSRVSNQDLKGSLWKNNSSGLQFENIDYLIITKEAFLPAASRLAAFRAKNNKFNVKVASVESIYNEFSTGKQDVAAIRNFIKYIYDNESDDKKLKFVCFIGDGSYDYKDVIRGNTNDVPLLHSIVSNSFINSYSTDDFYGFMDDEEGGSPNSDTLDLAVGRMIAPSLQVAEAMVNKVIRYYDKNSFGDWRTKQLYISDDVDQSIDSKLQDTLNNIADRLKRNIKSVNVEKLFADAFVQQISSGGERYPKVRSEMLNAFESGVSYVNYFGHGGESGLAGEAIFSAEDAKSLANTTQLPVFTTFTCELTRFDNPLRLTAGEFMYWNEKGGAIALLTTIRQLTFDTAIALNRSLEKVYSTNEGFALPIGEALRLAKVAIGVSNNKRTVFCVGDPAISIPLPDKGVRLTKINDVVLNEENGFQFDGQLRALDRVRLTGEVLGVGGDVDKNYQGEVSVLMFDKDFKKTTLANDGTRECLRRLRGECVESGEVIKIDFDESGNQIFRGLASVKNGVFDIEFILSRNIQLVEGEGKISLYSKNTTNLNEETDAFNLNIGGVNTNAPEDIQPPVVDLFLNDESFISGQSVNDSPILLVKFADESGINTAGGVGHDIIVVLDNDDKNPIILNDYYSTDLDDFTKGNLSFRLRNLEPGEHTLKVRASDVYNNVVLEEINFRVSAPSEFQISTVLNYPNPFVSYTEFRFRNTADPTENLETTVQIMTVSGKIIRTLRTTLRANETFGNAIQWNGRDDFGDKIGKGVYVYKISVKSTFTNKTSSKFEKLVIL